MALTEEQLEEIGEYIQSRLPEWLDRISRESAKEWLFRFDPELYARCIKADLRAEERARKFAEPIGKGGARAEENHEHSERGKHDG